MQIQLVAMLILASWAQVKRDERPNLEPRPVPRFTVIHVRVGGGERHDLTLEMPAQAAGVDEGVDQPPIMPVDLRSAELAPDNFDRWLFPLARSEKAREEHLNEILGAKINLAASTHKLSDGQRAKLRLAGRGDIKRFFDEVQTRKNDFEIARKTFNTGLMALQRLDELSPSYRDGPFGTRSLFAKTLNKINNDRAVGD